MPATMLCPQCRAEYRKGFTTCSDCQISLIPKLPEKDEPIKALPYVVIGIVLAVTIVLQLMRWPLITKYFGRVVTVLLIGSVILRLFRRE